MDFVALMGNWMLEFLVQKRLSSCRRRVPSRMSAFAATEVVNPWALPIQSRVGSRIRLGARGPWVAKETCCASTFSIHLHMETESHGGNASTHRKRPGTGAALGTQTWDIPDHYGTWTMDGAARITRDGL
jgi:hypothetical protein